MLLWSILGIWDSVSSIILSMMETASTGYLPRAVSSESITASLPSMMAKATSVTSALVGSGLSIIVYIICVAVMTGFLAALVLVIILLSKKGTFSIGIFWPRSPRAIMIASLTAIISSKLSSASCRSILAMILGL